MTRFARSVLLTMILLTAFPVQSAERIQLRGETMGTYYSIVVDSFAGSEADGRSLKADVEARLAEINRQMSTWDKESEITRFNQSDSTDWFAVSPEFAEVVTEAQRIYRLTDGAFDPTVSPLIDLWGFGDRRPKTVPESAAIQQALSTIGMQHIEVRTDPPSLKKDLVGVQLNLSAIAKGYGVDAIATLLAKSGNESFIVDIGGENRAGAAKASGQAWRVGVESPIGGKFQRIMEITNAAIATSGDYRNSFQVDGVVYSHAISPKTGHPVKNPPASVSVRANSCMTADALATALMVMGTQKGTALSRQHELSVMFQTVSEEGEVSVVATGEFVLASSTESAEAGATPKSSALTDPSESATWIPFAAAAVIFLIAAAGMSIGVILQNKSLKGSCGGLGSMPGGDGQSPCQLCTIPKDQCSNMELREQLQAAALNEAEKECGT